MSAPIHLRRRLLATIGQVRARIWAISVRGVEVGTGARIGRGCRLIIERDAHLVLGEGAEVDDGTTLAAYGRGWLVLGPGSFVGHHSTLACHRSVRLGSGAFLAEMVSVRDHDHAVGSPPSTGEVVIASVEIGSDAWLGAKATVLKGSTIGEGAVVGANAVVHGDVPAATVAVGVPVRILGAIADRRQS